jgi:hypothetical protein
VTTAERVLRDAARLQGPEPDGLIARLNEEIDKRTGSIVSGRATHEEYLRSCGFVEGLRRALVIVGQGHQQRGRT